MDRRKNFETADGLPVSRREEAHRRSKHLGVEAGMAQPDRPAPEGGTTLATGDLVQLDMLYWQHYLALTVYEGDRLIGYKVPSDGFGIMHYVNVDVGWHGILTEVNGDTMKVLWPNGQTTIVATNQVCRPSP